MELVALRLAARVAPRLPRATLEASCCKARGPCWELVRLVACGLEPCCAPPLLARSLQSGLLF
eukprot:1226205-Alexandrium_andersonii.AAC.1